MPLKAIRPLHKAKCFKNNGVMKCSWANVSQSPSFPRRMCLALVCIPKIDYFTNGMQSMQPKMARPIMANGCLHGQQAKLNNQRLRTAHTIGTFFQTLSSTLKGSVKQMFFNICYSPNFFKQHTMAIQPWFLPCHPPPPAVRPRARGPGLLETVEIGRSLEKEHNRNCM